MKPFSKKRAKRNADCKDFRDQFREEVGHCELCGHDPTRVPFGNIAWRLEVHEIARGTANRQKAMDKRYAILVVCYPCHHDRLSSRLKWPEAKQLAVLKLNRPEDYDLAAYNALVGRGSQWVTEKEVIEEMISMRGFR